MANKHDGYKIDAFSWDKVDKAGPKPVPPGLYLLRVVGASIRNEKTNELLVTKNGHAMVALQFVAVKRIVDGNVEDVDNKGKIWENLTFSEAAAFKTKQFCEAAGVAPIPMKKLTPDTLEEWADGLLPEDIPVEVFATVTNQKQDSGRMRANVGMYLTEQELEELAEGEASVADEDEDEDTSKAKRRAKATAAPNGKRRAAAADLEDEDEEEEEQPLRRRRNSAATAQA